MTDAARLRLRVEAAVEALIALLDALDGDPDAEHGEPVECDGDFEPREVSA